MVGFQTNEIPVKKLAGIRTGLDMEVFENFHLNMMANILQPGKPTGTVDTHCFQEWELVRVIIPELAR